MIIILKKQRLFNLMTFGLLFFLTTPTLAQPNNNNQDINLRIPNRVLFKPPPEEKQPEETTDAGSRGNLCPQDALVNTLNNVSSQQNSLISIVPQTNFGLTVAQRPILAIYLPETSAKQVVLSIKEEGKTHHSQTFFPITGKSGIVSFELSNDSPPLEVEKNYQWSVVVICTDKPSPNDPAIASWIRRITLSETIHQSTPLEQASRYAEQGIWYDALSSLMQARRSQPENQDLIEIWVKFLEAEGLKAIATEPLQ